MRIGSLFAGIGGFDLAARWMGWTTAWVSEIDPYASAVLKKHFPEAPNLGDITQLNGHTAPPIDMLVGGFPCQDISVAGPKTGITGTRSKLWGEYARLIEETRPRWVVIENSAALRKRGLDRVLQDLGAFGYAAEWNCIPASAVGAYHQRDRIWIVAYPDSHDWGDGGSPVPSRRITRLELRGGGTGLTESDPVAPVADPLCDRGEAGLSGPLSWEEGDTGLPLHGSPAGALRRTFDRWWATEPNVGRVAHGVPSRVDRVRCLGNAIVPQIAFEIFSAINRYEILSARRSD